MRRALLIAALAIAAPVPVTAGDEGKVRGAYDEWTSGAGVVDWSDSPGEGLQTAIRLARESPGGGAG